MQLISNPRALAVYAALIGLVACESTPVAPVGEVAVEVQPSATTIPNSEAATYEWHNGGIISGGASGPLDFGVPSALAPNGERIFLLGNGTLSLHPKSVTGGGTFEHFDASGAPLGSGTWSATDLLSFHGYGQSQLAFLPPGSTAGRAHFKVVLDYGGTTVDGMLIVDCALPDVKFPPSIIEGSRLQLRGRMNFNQVFQFTGGTLFIAL